MKGRPGARAAFDPTAWLSCAGPGEWAPEVGINPLNSHRRWLVPLRGHGGFHLETGIMGKASPCPLRMFYGTVRGPMVRKSKKRIPFTDAVEEATYRCDICDIEATRTVKDP